MFSRVVGLELFWGVLRSIYSTCPIYSRVALNWPFTLVAELDFHFSNPVSLYWPLTLVAELPRSGQKIAGILAAQRPKRRTTNWRNGREAAKKLKSSLTLLALHFTGREAKIT